MNELLTTQETARILKVSTRTVLRWIQAGALAGVKLGEGRGAEWRIRKQDLDDYITAHLKPATRDEDPRDSK